MILPINSVGMLTGTLRLKGRVGSPYLDLRPPPGLRDRTNLIGSLFFMEVLQSVDSYYHYELILIS